MKNLIILVLLAAACGDSGNKNAPDAAPPIDGAVAPACFSGTPQTHDEIINACVDKSVTVIMKHPTLPLLNSDGTLPPLP